eukprot:gb/GFBE01051784.1/.p1 GENE.gb/GFBE01051784.1/~~gb/GFBE01051784.1/.p1  ORF type:complete len:276 (+),score=64.41 gb/GFBE01051784.1/:1-828(+)
MARRRGSAKTQPAVARLLRHLLPAVACWLLLCRSPWTAFLPSARPMAAAAARGGESRLRRQVQKSQTEQLLDAILTPKDQMWEESEDGMILRENYKGGRDPTSVFWAVVQPLASLGFLIVGLSTYFAEPIVDWNPITAEYLGFLRPMDSINWLPQGAFMTFYGFFGFFFFGPLQVYIVVNNAGKGVCEFNKKTRKMYIVRDNELQQEMDFDDFQCVKFDWTNLAITGNRDVYLVTKGGRDVKIFDIPEDMTKRVLELRAAKLSEFLDIELVVDDA